jgi:hypothetical protein
MTMERLLRAFTFSEVKVDTGRSMVCRLSAEKYQDFLELEEITTNQYSIPWN